MLTSLPSPANHIPFASGDASARRVLVTGATGFIGTALVRHCAAAGFSVVSTGRNLSPLEPLPNYSPADLLDQSCLPRLLDGIECVVHAAGLAHQFVPARDSADRFRDGNERLSEILARASVRSGVAHFVLISSVSVYGSQGSVFHTENDPCHPNGNYAVSKYRAERCAIKATQDSNTALTILRLATVYGEGDPGNVARLMRLIDSGRFVWIGRGLNRKSLIHREDVARACLAVLRAPSTGTAIYNVSGEPCTMREVVEALAKALGRRLPRWYLPAAPVLNMARLVSLAACGRGRLGNLQVMLSKWLTDELYDASKFHQMYDVKPQVSLEEGLRRETVWYRSLAD